ncbi:MAG: FKBP-type peptidyl-prolyl cis-trans isomerase [Bacteroidales bacterium]|nr:FKBP-type peptidyl-prolyl cis-trans isomerase [Candidatus Cryptobacteroides onthequi]MCQ2165773.1 FKBP-type peptidyl-prolyl cis-trans isomerase [Bacteroidales bacterium]
MRTRIMMALCMMLGLAACSKSATETLFNTQETNIDTFVDRYLQSNPDARVVYNKSVVRIVVAEGEGTELAKGGCATVFYAGYNFSGSAMNASTLFATNNSDVAAASKWNISDESVFAPAEMNLGDGLVEGLRLGMEGVRKGEECIILFSGKYGFGRQVGTIPANAALAYSINVQDIRN